MSKKKIVLLLAILTAIIAFFVFDLGRYLDLAFFKEQQAAIESYRLNRPVVTAVIFFLIYVAVTGLSLPGAAVMTLAGGAIFGLLWGTIIISFASTIGATLAFLAAARGGESRNEISRLTRRFDLDLRSYYRIYDYPNAFAFNNPATGVKTLETARANLTTSYRITRHLSLTLEAELRGTSSTDTRIQYDRNWYSLGVVWRQ